MNGALDDIEFLARSENRLRVLDAVRSAARDRREVHEMTGIPRTTVGRILSDFQERGLVRHDGRHYEITTFGDRLVAAFTSLTETVETMYDLGPALRWLPVEEFDFSIRRFADAEITLAKRSDTIAPFRRATDLVAEVNHFRFIAPGYAPSVLEAHWQATVHGTQTSEIVVADDVIDTIVADPETAQWFEEVVRSERVNAFRYDGTMPYAVGVFDDVATFALLNESDTLGAVVETTNAAIRSWVEATIDAYRDDADPIDPETFA